LSFFDLLMGYVYVYYFTIRLEYLKLSRISEMINDLEMNFLRGKIL